MKKAVGGVLAIAIVAVFATALASASDDAMTQGPALTLHKTKYGKVLFDGNSRALYLFGRDKSRSSTCYGSCAKAWPPFVVSSKPHAGAGVHASLIGTTRRKDG